MRKIQDWKTGTSFQGAIYKDDGEYIVKFRELNGKSLPDSDYFTNDLQDAKDTCDYQINYIHKVRPNVLLYHSLRCEAGIS